MNFTCNHCDATDTVAYPGTRKDHSYQDGKCADCGADDPYYKKPVTDVPDTGDDFAMDMWIILLTAGTTGLAAIYGPKKKLI